METLETRCIFTRCDNPPFYVTCRFCKKHYEDWIELKKDIVKAMIEELNPTQSQETLENGKH